MVNLDSVKNINSISVSDVNLHSVIHDTDTSIIGTDTYKNIIEQAKKLNTKPLTGTILSVKDGNMVFSDTSDWNQSVIQKYGDFSSTSSAYVEKQTGGDKTIDSVTSTNNMTELINNTDFSSTSSANMTDIVGKSNKVNSDTSSAFMSQINNSDVLSATSSATMSQIMNKQSGGARKRKPTKKAKANKKKQGKEEVLATVEEEDKDSSSSLSDSSSSSSPSEKEESAGKYMNGTRYLMSDTTSFNNASETSVSSSLSTEDLRFFRN
jgi:hypothetical protein